MATNQQLLAALKRAAEGILGRQLSDAEAQDLIKYFNGAAGSWIEKAKESVRRVANITEQQLLEKQASSDDADRRIRDLEGVVREWGKKK